MSVYTLSDADRTHLKARCKEHLKNVREILSLVEEDKVTAKDLKAWIERAFQVSEGYDRLITTTTQQFVRYKIVDGKVVDTDTLD